MNTQNTLKPRISYAIGYFNIAVLGVNGFYKSFIYGFNTHPTGNTVYENTSPK